MCAQSYAYSDGWNVTCLLFKNKRLLKMFKSMSTLICCACWCIFVCSFQITNFWIVQHRFDVRTMLRVFEQMWRISHLPNRKIAQMQRVFFEELQHAYVECSNYSKKHQSWNVVSQTLSIVFIHLSVTYYKLHTFFVMPCRGVPELCPIFIIHNPYRDSFCLKLIPQFLSHLNEIYYSLHMVPNEE